MMAFHTSAQLVGTVHSYLFNTTCNIIDQTLTEHRLITTSKNTASSFSPSPDGTILRWGQRQTTPRWATLAWRLLWVKKQSKLSRSRKSSLSPSHLPKNSLDREPALGRATTGANYVILKTRYDREEGSRACWSESSMAQRFWVAQQISVYQTFILLHRPVNCIPSLWSPRPLPYFS